MKEFFPVIRSRKSVILSASGALCFILAVIFLEVTAVAGIFSTLGLVLLLCGGRCAGTKRDIIVNGVLLWAGHSIRFCGLFGTEILYTLYCSLMFVPYCALLMAVLCLSRRLRGQGRPFLSILIISLTYAVCSYLLAALNLGFITNLMSYIMCIPVIAVNLSLTGEYGMTFILLLILMSFSAACLEVRKRTKIIFAAVSLFMAGGLLTSGTILRSRYKEPDLTVEVALATAQEMDFTGENGIFYTEAQQLEMFSEAMKKAAKDNAKLLVLHEEYFQWREEYAEKMLAEVSQIVRQYGIPALLGIEVIRRETADAETPDTETPDTETSDTETPNAETSDTGTPDMETTDTDTPDVNEAVYIDADGQILCTYIKNNLVPFLETGEYEDGPEDPAFLNVTIDGHSVDLAFIICYDINDDAYLRRIPSSTDLLIVPSWDWDTENIEQKRTAVRSASLGVTLVKHSYDGFSYVSCPNGDRAEEIDLRGQYETVKTVTVPVWE